MLEMEDHQLAISDASDTMNFWNNRVNIYDKLSLIARSRQFLLRLQVRPTLKGFFSVCLLLVAETE